MPQSRFNLGLTLTGFWTIQPWFFETLPSQRKIMFSLFNQSFYHHSLPFLTVFLWFLSHFSLSVSWHKTAVVLVVEMHWIALTLSEVCIHSWHALVVLDFFVDLFNGLLKWESLRKNSTIFQWIWSQDAGNGILEARILNFFPGQHAPGPP